MDFASFAADVGVAFGLGVVIGFERELRNHEAGLQSNAYRSLGANMISARLATSRNQNNLATWRGWKKKAEITDPDTRSAIPAKIPDLGGVHSGAGHRPSA